MYSSREPTAHFTDEAVKLREISEAARVTEPLTPRARRQAQTLTQGQAAATALHYLAEERTHQPLVGLSGCRQAGACLLSLGSHAALTRSW